LFRNAGNLAVRFPMDWEISAAEALISFDGTTITVTPVPETDLDDVFDRLIAAGPVPDDWVTPPDPAAEPISL